MQAEEILCSPSIQRIKQQALNSGGNVTVLLLCKPGSSQLGTGVWGLGSPKGAEYLFRKLGRTVYLVFGEFDITSSTL